MLKQHITFTSEHGKCKLLNDGMKCVADVVRCRQTQRCCCLWCTSSPLPSTPLTPHLYPVQLEFGSWCWWGWCHGRWVWLMNRLIGLGFEGSRGAGSGCWMWHRHDGPIGPFRSQDSISYFLVCHLWTGPKLKSPATALLRWDPYSHCGISFFRQGVFFSIKLSKSQGRAFRYFQWK